MLKYFYIDDVSKLQCGPFTSQELLRKDIRPETVVWRSGMSDWVEAGTLQELDFLFDSKIPIPQDYKEVKEQQSYEPLNIGEQNSSRQYQNEDTFDDIIPVPKNWLLESILLTIFCCSPISLVGIFYAIKVESLYYAKEYKASLEASRKAKLWALFGAFFLPLCYVLIILLGSGILLFV